MAALTGVAIAGGPERDRRRFAGLKARRRQAVRRRISHRLAFVAAGFFAAFVGVSARLVDVMVLKGGDSGERVRAAADLDRGRADIVDREGQILATDLTSASLYADARKVVDPQATAAALAQVFRLDEAALAAELSSRRAFVWIKRHLTPQERFEVYRLALPGLYFQRDHERVYPAGRLAAHVVGFADIDGNGLAGMERALDARAKEEGREGAAIALTIDLRVQYALTEELAAAIARFDAIGGSGIILNARTGVVLALASLPDFDPNQAGAAGEAQRFNRVTMGVYEQGSTFKSFTIAAALDAGAVTLDSQFDASHPLRIGRYTISDYHGKKRMLTVPETFIYSSNIAAALIAEKLGGERLSGYFAAFGLTHQTPFELPELGSPLVPDRWSEVATMTAGYGHGIAVSPLHVAAAAASLVNGGTLVRPTLLAGRRAEAGDARRIISARTSEIMRALMRLNVEEGSGKQADTPDFPVGGKTGTAEKPSGGGYDRHALMSSFLGVFPAYDPEYVILVSLDEPKGTKETHGYATAGWTAAPVVGAVVGRIGPILAYAPAGSEETRERHNVVLSSYAE
ncbi:MAG: penicillin-binding protein 2 [Alphaproteobacteria bacterium]|nr:penicillin-binding protein 2 [Alphaproteobacteria bacterium]